MNVLLCWASLVLVIYPANSFSPNDTTYESRGKDSFEVPNESCITDPTFPCIQKKLVYFLDRLSKVKAFSILGDWIFVVKVNETSDNVTEKFEGRMGSDHSSNIFGKSLQNFFTTHIIRLTLPDGITAKVNGENREFGTSVDISVGRAIGEARKKVKLKHMMNMMMSGLMSKAAMLGPLLMMIVKIKAFKALVLSTLALALSKIQLFKMLMKGKGGSKEVIILHESHGGGGGHGGGSWSSGGDSWSSAGSEGHITYVPPNDSGMGYGGNGHGVTTTVYGVGGGGGWSNGGGGGGYGGGAGSWASASGDSYGSGDGGHGGGGHGGGGGGGGWGSGWASRNYDPNWLAYKTNKTDTKHLKRH